VVAVEKEPALSPGRRGTFDESGCTVSCLVEDAGRLLLYYTGWTLGRSVPFYLFAGLAISRDRGLSFERHSEAPLLERSAVDPILTASPMVLRTEDLWRMYYVSATAWQDVEGKPRHSYHVRYADSRDGLAWRREGRVCLDYSSPEEYAFGRPCVRAVAGGHEMYFCSRGDRYRLGVARSSDGLVWERQPGAPELTPEVSSGDWDEEMRAYPQVIRGEGVEFLLYNGNGYGASGIGYAQRSAD